MVIALLFILHWYLSFFLQSFFYHRYAAHKHFTMSRSVEKCFFVFCFLIHGSSYMSPAAYTVMHRLHHMHSDTHNDPHTPVFNKNFFATLIQTRNSYHAIYTRELGVDDKFLKDLTQWDAFEKIAHNWMTRILWILIYLSLYTWLATAWWQFLFLPLTIIMCSFQGAMINWWAHRFGYVNYETGDASKNILPVDFLFIGDAYHNNHHKYPGRVKNAHKWFEIDPIYHVTCFFVRMKIVTWKHPLAS